MLKLGYTLQAIGKRFNCHPDVMSSNLKKFGELKVLSASERTEIKFKSKIAEFEKYYSYADVLTWRKQNWSLKEIADNCNVPYTFIRKYVKYNGGSTTWRYSKEDMDYIKTSFETYGDIELLCCEYHSHPQAIYNVLKRMNVPLSSGFGTRTIYNGFTYDSKVEAKVARILSEDLKIEYQNQKRYDSETYRTADFFVQEYNLYIEVSTFNHESYLQRIEGKRSSVDNFLFINTDKASDILNLITSKIQKITNP